MKVLQLTTHFSPNLGGVETHLDDLVAALTKRNYKVFVLTYRPLISNVSWKIHENGKDLEILRLPWFPGLFYKLVKSPVLEFIYLTPGLFFICPFVLLIKKPKVIHAHGLIASFVGVFWGKIFGIRVVSTTHSIYSFPKKGLYNQFAKWIFQNSNAVLTLSKQSKKEIESLGVVEDNIKVFTYWVDIEKFKPSRTKLKFKKSFGLEKKFVVLFVGRLVSEKGVGILLKSAGEWKSDIELLIVGDGPMKSEVEREAGDNNNVKYFGRVEQKDLPKLYSLADVTIVPSIHEEGFGRVILESLACGTPIIGSKRGAIPEAMDESVGKFIEATLENIKSVVEYYYKNTNSLKALSKNARRYAVKRFSEANIKTIINAYK